MLMEADALATGGRCGVGDDRGRATGRISLSQDSSIVSKPFERCVVGSQDLVHLLVSSVNGQAKTSTAVEGLQTGASKSPSDVQVGRRTGLRRTWAALGGRGAKGSCRSLTLTMAGCPCVTRRSEGRARPDRARIRTVALSVSTSRAGFEEWAMAAEFLPAMGIWTLFAGLRGAVRGC
jgi:hypothetical protein